MPWSRDDGSYRARFLLIGEAYGYWESQYDRPFVGPSYRDQLLPWWTSVGLTREDFFITNAWDQGQPQNINAINQQDMRESWARLEEKIAAFEGPDGGGPIVIVPTGNYALYALTGLGKVHWHMKDGRHERPGIQDWRGSILTYDDRRGRRHKVIPTIHPAAIFRAPQNEWLCRMDWARIASDGQFRDLRLPQYTKIASPSRGEVLEWFAWTRGEAAKTAHLPQFAGRMACSLDVETPYKAEYALRQKESTAKNGKCRECGHTKQWHRDSDGDADSIADAGDAVSVATDAPASSACAGIRGKGGCDCAGFLPLLSTPRNVKIDDAAYLACVGYSWNPDLTICVPTTLEYWQDPTVFAEIMAAMRAFHADTAIDFGGQNFMFDAWWCHREKIALHALGWDLMKMHRVQRPYSKDHDLATQASVDTRHPFWKHEAKTPGELSAWSTNNEQLRAYNCTDNSAQRRLLDVRLEALHRGGRWEYYAEIEHPIDTELLELSTTGFRVDEAGRQQEWERVSAEMVALAVEINELAKCTIIGDGGGVSNDKLKKFLYGRGVATPVWEKPLVENTAKSAKCMTCNHTRDKCAPESGICVAIIRPLKAICGCSKFVAPQKPGKRVQTGETYSGGLQLPEQYIKGPDKKKHVSANIVSVKRLMDQYPTIELLQQVGGKVLRHRRLATLQNSLKAERVVNGRQYALFKQDTLLGRLSSQATPDDEGANLQNVDRRARKYYLPDTGEERY